eukprot:PITA_01409
MEEGKLLGHIISKDGIHIDPERVEAVPQLYFPRNKKEIQSFNGKINFLRRFIPNLAEHLREMADMLKKESEVRWSVDAKKYFNAIKFSLSTAPTLINLDYTSDFIIFSLVSEHTLAAVLMEKEDQKNEQPIAFFNRTIRDAALKYNIIEKQTDPEGRRGKWIATMLEYDLEIKPTKLIKGKGLAKLTAESNLHALDINLIVALFEEEEEDSQLQVFDMFTSSPWYSDIVYILQHLNPPLEVHKGKSRSLKLKASKYCILDNVLFWKDPGGILLNCLVENEAKD